MSESDALVFRINDNGEGPDILKQIFQERGWVEFDERCAGENDWNIWWKGARFRNCDHDQIKSWQRLNHFPNSTGITKKDCLARNFRRMKAVYGGGIYNFCPDTFNIPNDYKRFVAEYSKKREHKASRDLLWICKPADMSRGRGIFIFRNLSELHYDCSAIIQRYISNPLLIGGYKFDIRIYVAVPSFQPLAIYIYQEGLVRFGTEKYDLTCLDNIFSHLTNTSINKYSPSYTVDKEKIGQGCKWTLTQLRQYFRQVNIDDEAIFTKIVNIVILTIIIQAPQVPHTRNCFELYGFDILIDEKLKPILLEVNFSPALSYDCQADIAVKKPLLHDLLDMLKFSKKDSNRKVKVHKYSAYKKSQKLFPGRRTTNFNDNQNATKCPNINDFGRLKQSVSFIESEDSGSDLDMDTESNTDNRDNSICYGLPLVNTNVVDNDHNSDDTEEHKLRYEGKENVLESFQRDSVNKQSTLNSSTSITGVASNRNGMSSTNKLPYIDKVSRFDSTLFDSGYSGSSDNLDRISWSEDSFSIRNSQHHRQGPLSDTRASSRAKRSRMSHALNQTRKPASFICPDSGRLTSVSTSLSLDTYDRHNECYPEIVTATSSVTNVLHHRNTTKGQKSQRSSRSVHVKRPSTSHTLSQKSLKSQRTKPSSKVKTSRLSYSACWSAPEKNIGDFYNVFPFNEITKKLSASIFDVKGIVQEVHKRSKQADSNKNSHKSEQHYHANDKFLNYTMCPDTIWRPLKHVDDS